MILASFQNGFRIWAVEYPGVCGTPPAEGIIYNSISFGLHNGEEIFNLPSTPDDCGPETCETACVRQENLKKIQADSFP